MIRDNSIYDDDEADAGGESSADLHERSLLEAFDDEGRACEVSTDLPI